MSSQGHRLQTALVQGASRGIGLEFVRQLLFKYRVPTVFASCRNPSTATQLHHMQEQVSAMHTQHAQQQALHILHIDLNDEQTISESALRAKETLEACGCHLQLLINAAGVLHQDDIGMQPERSLAMVEEQWLKILFQTHSIGPLLVTKHFHPLMVNNSPPEQPSKLVNMSARVGSIGDNYLGGWYGYRVSKSALNQITKTSAIELVRKNIIAFALHPGTVDTDLSKPFQSGVRADQLMSVESCVERLMRIIVTADRSMNGGLYDYNQTVIPW